MIAVLKHGTTPAQVQHLVDWLKHMNLDVHISEGAEVIELQPQEQHVRKLQHELVEAHGFKSVSVGEGSQRHLKIFKDE